MSNGAEAIYLDQIVELSVELLSFRTMVQVLLGQQRDLQKQLKNSQRALKYRTGSGVHRDTHR